MYKSRPLLILTILLTAFALSLLAAAPEQDPQQQEEASTTGQDEKLLQLSEEVLQQVVEIRGLQVKRDIVQEVKSRDEIRKFLLEKLAVEYPDEELKVDERIFRRLGLLSEDDDLKGLFVDLLTEQVAGFYDPISKTFSIADWIPDVMQKPVMAHELLHALQDQHFDLDTFMRQVDEDDDRFMARQAVVEGEGVAVMFDYMLQPMGQQFQDLPQLEMLITQAQNAAPQSAVMRATPAFLKDLLFFPYIQGAVFIGHFRRENPWENMAGIFKDPPQSSEQILHPEKYFDQRDDPTPVEPTQEPPQELEGSWTRVADGTLGEYMLSRLMQPFIPTKEAEDAARGWDGDRYEWFEAEDGRHALWVRSVWDSRKEARQFHEAFIKTLRARTNSPSGDEDQAGDEVVLKVDGRVYKVHHDDVWVRFLDYDQRP